MELEGTAGGYFEIISCHLPGETKKATEKHEQNIRLLPEHKRRASEYHNTNLFAHIP
jgi:hypothetical protein